MGYPPQTTNPAADGINARGPYFQVNAKINPAGAQASERDSTGDNKRDRDALAMTAINIHAHWA